MEPTLAIVGYRYFTDYERFCRVVDKFIAEHGRPYRIISGGCIGADQMAERYAKEHGIAVNVFEPNKSLPGNSGFAVRDREIARACTYMIAFPSPSGRGTQLTIKFARECGKEVAVEFV
jgi:predicted Rossmann fold nucleotide-binding protein DprA/Smf involved in DNA uptake